MKGGGLVDVSWFEWGVEDGGAALGVSASDGWLGRCGVAAAGSGTDSRREERLRGTDGFAKRLRHIRGSMRGCRRMAIVTVLAEECVQAGGGEERVLPGGSAGAGCSGADVCGGERGDG